MNKTIKKLLSLMLTAAMVVGVTACGGTNTPSEGVDTANEATAKETVKEDTASGDAIEIRLASRWGGEEILSVYFNEKIEEFNALNNGIKIIADNVTDEQQYFDKLSTQIGAGTQPDIFINYGGTSISEYIDSDLLLDLGPYLEEDTEWKDSFLPLFDKWEKDGSVYGVPVMLYAILLYYNTEILEANDIPVPETIEDLTAACDTLTANGIAPFMLGENSVFRAGHLLNNLAYKTFGEGITDSLADRSINYDSPEMIELYQTIKDWNDKGYFGENAVSVDNNGEKASFLSGESAFRYDGAWFVGEITGSDVEGKADVTAFPYFSDKPEYKTCMQGGSGQGFSVSDSGDEAKNSAAVEVVKYLTSQDYYAGLEKASNGGIYPVEFTSDPETEIDEMTLKVKDIIAESSAFRGDLQDYDPEVHMLNTVRTALQGLFVGNTPEQCAEEIVSQEEVK